MVLMYIKVRGSHTTIIFMTHMVITVICQITTIMNGLKMEAILGIIPILATSTIQPAMKFGTTNQLTIHSIVTSLDLTGMNIVIHIMTTIKFGIHILVIMIGGT